MNFDLLHVFGQLVADVVEWASEWQMIEETFDREYIVNTAH